MKVKVFLTSTFAAIALCFSVAQMGNSKEVASTTFSSQVAENSYVASGDMNAEVSSENQFLAYEASGEELKFTASLSCTTRCSTMCTTCCSHKCSGASYCAK